jgi:hypothetical protein
LTPGPGNATLGAIFVHVDMAFPTSRRAVRSDALGVVLACLVTLVIATPPASGERLGAHDVNASPPAKVVFQARELLRQGDVVLSLVQPTTAAGLEGSVLRVLQGGRSTDIALDGTLTGRRARMVGSARYLPAVGRAVLHLDPDHDASGLLVVDIAAGVVVDAVTAHDLVPSPDGRFWAFEEHALRTVAVWPHTETVYAVYDAAVPPAVNARPCPSADDRCRGQALFLPDRLALCRAIAAERGGPCLTPGRSPRHVRRSPFVWLSPTEVAWVDVDVARQDSTLVLAKVGGVSAVVQAVALERGRVIEDVDFPSAREGWTIDGISRDGDPARVWLHFRSPMPQAPRRRLGIRVGRRRRASKSVGPSYLC